MFHVGGYNPVVPKRGYKFTKEHCEKIGRALLGHPNWLSEESKIKISNSLKGRTIPQEVRNRISKSSIGHVVSIETRRKISLSNTGKHHTAWNKGLIGFRTSGSFKGGGLHPNWRGGLTPLNKAIRGSIDFKLWRRAVFERDNYTCQHCGIRGGVLHPDHIKPFALYPELRFNINNGRTLCEVCHKKTNTWGWKTTKLVLVKDFRLVGLIN